MAARAIIMGRVRLMSICLCQSASSIVADGSIDTDPGVGHNDVESAEVLDGGGNGFGGVGGVAGVTGYGDAAVSLAMTSIGSGRRPVTTTLAPSRVRRRAEAAPTQFHHRR
jgi:hypothetical protein